MLFFCDISLVIYCTLRVGVNVNKGWPQVCQVLTRKMDRAIQNHKLMPSQFLLLGPFPGI